MPTFNKLLDFAKTAPSDIAAEISRALDERARAIVAAEHVAALLDGMLTAVDADSAIVHAARRVALEAHGVDEAPMAALRLTRDLLKEIKNS